jgi:uncharacterized protein (DUF3084 family)
MRLRRRPLPRYHPVMDVFTFVIAIIVLSGVVAPLAKGLGNRLGKGGSPAESAKLARVVSELEAAEQRLGDAERRLQLAEERLDFQEKLLTARSSRRAPDEQDG